MSDKLQDETNLLGGDYNYFSRENLEMLFWVGIIYLIYYLFP